MGVAAHPLNQCSTMLNDEEGTSDVWAKIPMLNLLEQHQQQADASTLRSLTQTLDVRSPTFNMFPLILGGILTE